MKKQMIVTVMALAGAVAFAQTEYAAKEFYRHGSGETPFSGSMEFENVTGYGLQGPYYEGTVEHPFERFVFRNCRWRTVGDNVLPGSECHGAAAKERFREEKFVQVREFSGTFGKGSREVGK